MNAMAALYHIPQNDAPTLADAHWSNDFRSFVETCLIKDPENRPNATQAMTVCIQWEYFIGRLVVERPPYVARRLV